MDTPHGIRIVKVTALIVVGDEPPAILFESGNVIAFEEVEMTLSEVSGSQFNKVTEHTEETQVYPPEEEPPKKAKKSKRGRPTSVSKRTKKAMSDLKKNKRPFTKDMFGWNKTEDNTLIPNWKEQQLIDWMKSQLKEGKSASHVARILTELGIKGKTGGKWQSSSVLRTTRNDFHLTRAEFTAPQYITWTMKRPYDPAKDY